MRVVPLPRGPFASLPSEPRRVGRITPADGGIDLHILGQPAVPFGDLRAVSAGQVAEGALILLVVAGQARPFSASPLQISFPEFPFPHRPMVATNLRGFLFYLVKQCPDLLLDTDTAQFLEGSGLASIKRLAQHGAALMQIVAEAPPAERIRPEPPVEDETAAESRRPSDEPAADRAVAPVAAAGAPAAGTPPRGEQRVDATPRAEDFETRVFVPEASVDRAPQATIREATAADFAQIWPIFREIAAAGETYAYPRDIEEADARRAWLETPRQTFVAEDEGRILGTYFIRTNHSGPGDHVCNCGYMVSSAARGRGLATAMCRHSQEMARELGYQAMQFNFVASTNQSAVALWTKLGFETVGRLPRAFRHPAQGLVDALVMYKWLGE